MTLAGKTEEKPDSLPSVDISMNTSPALKLMNGPENVPFKQVQYSTSAVDRETPNSEHQLS